MADMTAQVFPSNFFAAIVTDVLDHLADQVIKLTKALVVISPKTMTKRSWSQFTGNA